MSGTSSSKFTAATTVPNQESWGAYQRFDFADTFPHVKLQAYSEFVPTSNNTSTINIETRNSRFAGFRFQQLSQTADVNQFGSFHLQSFVSDGDGTDIFSFDGTDFDLYYPVDVNNNIIKNLSPGVAGTDAVNVNQLNSAISASTITLTGNVTGSGTVGTPFATTIASRLNQIPTPTGNVSLNSQKITNLANGTNSADGVNLSQMNTAISSAVSAGTITLTGNVTGSGTVGTPFATTIVSTLNNIPVATGAVNLNSQNLISTGNIGVGVSSPTISLQFPNATDTCKIALYQNAANKFQVFGFGIAPGILRYSVGNTNDAHVFYGGSSSTTSAEFFTIKSSYASCVSGTGTFYSRVPSVHISLPSGIPTTTPNLVFTKLNGTTSATSGGVQFTTSNNRITYTGSDLGTSCTGMVSASLNVAFNDTSICIFAIYLNGSQVTTTYTYGKSDTTNQPFSVVIPRFMATLSPGDYLEIWAASTVPTTVISVSRLNLTFDAC